MFQYVYILETSVRYDFIIKIFVTSPLPSPTMQERVRLYKTKSTNGTLLAYLNFIVKKRKEMLNFRNFLLQKFFIYIGKK